MRKTVIEAQEVHSDHYTELQKLTEGHGEADRHLCSLWPDGKINFIVTILRFSLFVLKTQIVYSVYQSHGR